LEYNEQIKICRSVALLADPEAFLRLLVYAIDKLDPKTFIRLNVLSDIPFELVAPWLFEMYSGNDCGLDFSSARRPMRRFYDYTKVFGRNPPGNYHLVHSFSGYNAALCKEVMANGGSVAVVGIRERPARFWNYQTVDGDAHDIRPIDKPNSIVWLKLKSTPNNLSLIHISEPTRRLAGAALYPFECGRPVHDGSFGQGAGSVFPGAHACPMFERH
jgi:hypothetical protein